MHVEHCQTMGRIPSVMGVKKSCLLNSLQYFHRSENCSVYIMHGILEGVGQHEVKLLLQYLQNEHLTSKEWEFRASIMAIWKEATYSRSEVTWGFQWFGLKSHSVLVSTTQSNTYLCWLGVSKWSTLAFVFSPVLSDGITVYLKHLIAEHHILFKHFFPGKRLLSKHFMVHHPWCIQKIGPILHSWCRRY